MKILLSAASCSPYVGSESAIGWKVASHLAKNHEVHAIVFKGYKKDIKKAHDEGLIPETLHFHYLEPNWEKIPNPRKEKEFWWRSYAQYLSQIEELATRLHAEKAFDLAHHVTFASWRMPVPLHRLGIPFVWGPVGGAEKFPSRLLRILGLKAATFELIRYAWNAIACRNQRLREMIKESDAIVASNPDAYELINRIRGTKAGMHSLLVTSFTLNERKTLGHREKPQRRDPNVLYAFASGALEGRKGVSLAIEAIALAKSRGLRIRYRVGSHGPELEYLRRLVKKHDLENEVIFGEMMPREEYVNELLESDIYLLPSLRDNAPSTLMEAMLAGCVPIVAACGGPNVIVSDDCGFRIPVASREALVIGIADALLHLQSNPMQLNVLGMKARNRIMTNYTMESYLEKIYSIYEKAIEEFKKNKNSSIGNK